MQGSRTNLFTKNSFLKFSLIKQTRSVILLTGISFALVACGGGGGGPIPVAPEKNGSVSGTAFIGDVSTGTVDVYSFDAGVRGKSLASGTIKSEPRTTDVADKDKFEGKYSIALKVSSRAIMVCLSDATYQEMSQDRLISFIVADNQELCAVDYYVSGSSLKMMLTYYSHIGAGLAKFLVSSGEKPSVAVTKANQEIEAWTIFNPTTVNPINIRYSIDNQQGISAEDRAGLANAAISAYSGWVNGVAGIAPKDPNDSTGQTPNPKRFVKYNSILFAQRAYDDIVADGLLDGQSANGPTGMGPVTLKVSTYRRDIALDMLVMANSPKNRSGLLLQGSPLSGGLLSYAEDYSLFDHPDAPVTRKPSALNIFGSVTTGGVIDGTKPILNNFIIPKIISGSIKLAASLTDIQNVAKSVEYKLINNSLAPPVKKSLKIIAKSPTQSLSRTIVSLDTTTYADDANYELKVFVDGVEAFSRKGIIIQNVGTKIVGPSQVSTSNTVNGLFNLVASVTNAAGINSIALEIDGNLSSSPVTNFTSGGTNNVPIFRIDSTTLANGLHTFVIIATDTVPLESRSTAPLSLTIAN